MTAPSLPEPRELVGNHDTRYIDFSRRSFGEHEYFTAEQGKTLDADLLALFTRFFRSGDDIPTGQKPGTVYRRGCDDGPLVCAT